MRKRVTTINKILTYDAPFLMAKFDPTKAPTIIAIPMGMPYAKLITFKCRNMQSAAMLLPKFRTLALPAEWIKSKPMIKKENNKKEPVPGPKNPS